MKTSLVHNRDVLAGLLFIAIGAGGFAVALSYPFGTVQQMGPGFFPRILGLTLAGFGAVTLIRGLRSAERIDGVWGWGPMLKLAAALVVFGWLMERVGLLPSLAVLTVLSASAGKEFQWREALVLTVAMAVLAWAIFIWGLGLPYPLLAFELGG